MTYAQVYNFFQSKRDTKCEYTTELISSGFHQNPKADGYLKIAEACKLKSFPSQWWHLMNYCLMYYEKHQEHHKFNEKVSCGELIFWMAEVSESVEKGDLEKLKNQILNEYLNNRKEANKLIKKICWDKIINAVENGI